MGFFPLRLNVLSFLTWDFGIANTEMRDSPCSEFLVEKWESGMEGQVKLRAAMYLVLSVRKITVRSSWDMEKSSLWGTQTKGRISGHAPRYCY